MNLIEVYIQEVIRRLPEKSREDIALELRSTIEVCYRMIKMKQM